jgi:mercuric ion transport protein
MSSDGAAKRKLSLGGAVIAALAASSCCIGPLLLAALGLGGAGLGGAGAFASMGAYRLPLLAVTGVLLAAGFYLTYREPKARDACGCDAPRVARAPKIALWIATAFTLLFAVSPHLLAAGSSGGAPSSPAKADEAIALEVAVIEVGGVDCDACAGPLRQALTAAGGMSEMKLDVPSRSVTVHYQAGPGRPSIYLRAIDDLGYEAKLVATRAP